jgi:hypothetical protein
MKLILSLILLAQLNPSNGGTGSSPGDLDFAIRESFIKCYANHWKGSQTVAVKDSEERVQLACSGFWKKYREQNSPFKLLAPGQKPEEIPYAVWSEALGQQLAQSKEPK